MTTLVGCRVYRSGMSLKMFLRRGDVDRLPLAPHTIIHTPDGKPPIPVLDTDEFTEWMADHGILEADSGVLVHATRRPVVH